MFIALKHVIAVIAFTEWSSTAEGVTDHKLEGTEGEATQGASVKQLYTPISLLSASCCLLALTHVKKSAG